MSTKWTPRFLNINIPNTNRLDDYQSAFMKIEAKHENLGLSQTSIITKNMISCRNLLKNLRKQHVNVDDTSNLEKRIKPLAIMWKKLIQVISKSIFKNKHIFILSVFLYYNILIHFSLFTQNFKVVDLETIKSEKCNICVEFKISEIQIANEITHVITSTLARFRSFDMNSLTSSDEKIILTLSDNSVPYEWRKIWNGPKIATDYLRAVSTRALHAIQLIDRAQDPITEIDFSTIFNVDSFLSMLKILTSRNLGVPPNNLVLDSECKEDFYERMKNQHVNIVKIHPLIIDGLNMEKQHLIRGSASLNSTCPFFLYFKEAKKSESPETRDLHSISVYSTFARDELLCTISLKSMMSQEEVVYSGTALVVNAN